MTRSAITLVSLLLVATAPPLCAQVDDAPKEPRLLGQKAVLHIYYYAPKTLEITFVDSYLFKDEATCNTAISAALQISMPHAGDGDLVSAKCIGMNPPEEITKPDRKRDSPDSTDL